MLFGVQNMKLKSGKKNHYNAGKILTLVISGALEQFNLFLSLSINKLFFLKRCRDLTFSLSFNATHFFSLPPYNSLFTNGCGWFIYTHG